jgi:hypothetical protein
LSEGLFKVLAESGQGDREKRFTFMFSPGRDRFVVAVGANSTPLPEIIEEHMRERDQAFHLGILSWDVQRILSLAQVS